MTSAVPEDLRLGTVRVAVVTTQQVVETGIHGLLEGVHGGLRIVAGGPVDREPDIVFYDVIGLHEHDGADLDHWVKETGSVVVAVTRELRPDLGAAALERGAVGAISLGASVEDFLEVIEAALAGDLDESQAAQDAENATRLGWEVGLTLREAELLGYIVRGLSNQEVADETFLSINSVKSYVRSAYRKMDVANRSQAVAWGIQHGFTFNPE